MKISSDSRVQTNDFVFTQTPGHEQAQYMQFLYDQGMSIRDISLFLAVNEELVLSKVNDQSHKQSNFATITKLASYLHEFSE
ncbi:hypothetical protein [Endozoicomonas sp. Mp262]|uniref:hypothetical protein n=1 Tax=Endozoicomonas sp. Mp262 TaxID=2919499 RepID=UPI0021D99A05